MCQFKIVAAPAAPGAARQRQTGGGGCVCTCSGGGATAAAASAAAAAEEELRRVPAQLLARYFTTCQQEAATAASMGGPSHRSSSRYSPAMAAELAGGYKKADSCSNNKDSNNNINNSNSGSSNCSSSSVRCTAEAAVNPRRLVQFADELGRSLIEVRLFESEPHVEEEDEVMEAEMEQLPVRLLCHFELPTAERALRALSGAACSVQLSGLRLDAPGTGGVSVSGCALVSSASYRKRVFVRVSADRWRSFADHEAEFAGSLGDRRDAFEFGIGCGGGLEEAELEFCVCLEAEGRCRDWDSNGGCNYRISLVLPRRVTFGVGGDVDGEE